MQAAMKEHKARRQARGLEHDALRRELALQAHRLEATSRASLAKGFTRVVENQRALEGEARQFKGAASYLLTQTAQWASQYQAFCADVEVGSTWCVCVGALGFCMPHVHCPRHALCPCLHVSPRRRACPRTRLTSLCLCVALLVVLTMGQSLCGVEDWAYQTEASLRHLAESLGSLTEWLSTGPE
jgi:hypothetical protein